MDEMESFLLKKCQSAFDAANYDLLLESAQKLERIAKNTQEARLYRGIAIYHKKEFKQARDIFYKIYLEQYVREKREDPMVLYYLALSNIYVGAMGNAVSILKKLEKKDPKNIDIKVLLYVALDASGDYTGSTAELAEALGIDKKKTVATLESIMLKALEHSKITDASKVLLVELVRDLGEIKI